MEKLIYQIEQWSKIYELNFQFWPKQCAVYIAREGIDLKDFGEYDMESIFKRTIEYLTKINPAEARNIKRKLMGYEYPLIMSELMNDRYKQFIETEELEDRFSDYMDLFNNRV